MMHVGLPQRTTDTRRVLSTLLVLRDDSMTVFDQDQSAENLACRMEERVRGYYLARNTHSPDLPASTRIDVWVRMPFVFAGQPSLDDIYHSLVDLVGKVYDGEVI